MEEREIDLNVVTGNALDTLDGMNPEDKGFNDATRAVDTLLKYNNESEKNDLTREQIKSTERIEMAKIESNERIEKDKIEAERVQHEEENLLRDKEIKAGLVDSVLKSTVIGVVIGEISYHVGMKVIGKFEESGVYRSLLSKSWINRFGKRK